MIDGEGDQRPAANLRPGLRGEQQRYRIAAAGQGDGDGTAAIGIQPSIEDAVAGRLAAYAAHFAWRAVAAARVVTAAGALG